jgi:hypothetical protein
LRDGVSGAWHERGRADDAVAAAEGRVEKAGAVGQQPPTLERLDARGQRVAAAAELTEIVAAGGSGDGRRDATTRSSWTHRLTLGSASGATGGSDRASVTCNDRPPAGGREHAVAGISATRTSYTRNSRMQTLNFTQLSQTIVCGHAVARSVD